MAPMSAPRTARDRAREQVRSELLDVARRHLVEHGPAALSLRAVARDLGMASSAVYRYVPSRDALLTLLITETYDEVGAVCEAAAQDAAAHGPGATWLAVARAFRAWAREKPQHFALVYGTPVPGYAAPPDTVSAAVRIWAVIARVLVAAREDGSLRPPRAADVDGLLEPGVLAFARAVAEGRAAADAMVATRDVAAGRADRPDAESYPTLEADVARSVTLFSALVGATSAELFGHLHGLAADTDRLFDLTTATAAVGVGLDVPAAADR